ncbi:hypothetical protein HNP40_001235 [Mycobacteroides chelonae]|nr:hypothetical protein [Mycobacteroides chelonae]
MTVLIGPWAYSPGSYLVLLESTVEHAVRAIKETRRRGDTRCEVRREPHDKYWQQMLSRAAKGRLPTPLCAGSNTYYINYPGDAAAYRPSTNTEMRVQKRYFPFTDWSSRGPTLIERAQPTSPRRVLILQIAISIQKKGPSPVR